MRGFNETGLIFSEGYAETMAGEALPYIGARRTDMRARPAGSACSSPGSTPTRPGGRC